MAKLSANGKMLVELIAVKQTTDNAESDPMTREIKVTYRAMSSGFVLKKVDSKLDYGFGNCPEKFVGTWKRHAKIKAELVNDKNKLFEAMQKWCDQLVEKGWDAELS